MSREELINALQGLGNNNETPSNSEVQQQQEQIQVQGEQTVEGQSVEQQNPETQEQQQSKNYYTPEELAEIIEKDLPIDTSRLTPEGIALMKSFQKGFTPKLQEAAEAKRQLEELKVELEKIKEATKSPEERLKDEFMRNPDKVLGEINSVISDLLVDASVAKAEGDESKLLEVKQKIVQLENIKSKLLMEKPKVELQQSTERERLALIALNNAVAQAPIIKEKGDDIYNYAVSKLGYTPEILQRMLDPIVNGVDVAAKNLVLLAKAYESYEIQNRANAIKPTATNVITQTMQNGGMNNNVAEEYKRILAEAQKGNVTLADVLEFKQKHNIR